jgi:hypothetical protein
MLDHPWIDVRRDRLPDDALGAIRPATTATGGSREQDPCESADRRSVSSRRHQLRR